MENYWNAFATNYRNLAPPLKPGPEDVAVVEDTLARWRADHPDRELNALLCGVTPALAGLKLPPRTRMLAAEQSEPMIRAIWPGNLATRAVVRANWLNLPIADHACDIILGDGCFNCLDFPLGYRALVASLHRVLARDGILLMRVFVRPSSREDVEAIFADLQEARIPSFHIFKWRLAMALQTSTTTGIVVDDIYQAWAARGIRSGDLATRLGWSAVTIDTIAAYKGKGMRFSFPALEEVRATLPDHFDSVFVRFPDYELGERCPMFALRPL
jgi:SAM-dependent methyltransferase